MTMYFVYTGEASRIYITHESIVTIEVPKGPTGDILVTDKTGKVHRIAEQRDKNAIVKLLERAVGG